MATITVQGEGATYLAGVAVGYDDEGCLVVEAAGVDRLGLLERRRLAAELRRLAREIGPRELN